MIDEILAKEVTFQDTVFSEKLKKIKIGDFLDLIKNEKYKSIIIGLRNYLNTGDKRRYEQNKKRLPSITFSGLFEETRKIESLIKYTDICVIDIDKISVQDIQNHLKNLYSDPYVFSFWLSPSGNGIKGLVKINYLHDLAISNPNEYHKYAFSKLFDYFKQKYNIEIDKTGSDITRLCFISSDNELVLKNQIEGFSVEEKTVGISVPVVRTKQNKIKSNCFNKKEHMNPENRNYQLKRAKIKNIVKSLKKRNLSITSSYEKWYRVAYAISSTFTYDLGEKYYLQLCRLDGARHNEEESIAMLRYSYMNSDKLISFGTILFYYKKLMEEVRGSRTEEVSSKIEP